MTFLKWILDTHPRVRKRSTLDEYWRVWCMLYLKSVGKGLHAKVMEEVRDYIEYNLDTGVLDTSVFPDERQRLQLALLLLLSAYTATRPAALVYKATDRTKQREHYFGWENDISSDNDEMDLDWEDIKTLCYEDVTLVMLPNPEGEARSTRHGDHPEVYQRMEEKTESHTYLYYLQRLGLQAGLMQILGGYVLRRGAGEAVEAVATQPQLQQVMCYRDAGIYQAYINQRVQCDVQAAFLDQPSSGALFKAVTHMSRHADPRAPTEPTSDEVNALKADPVIVQLRELRDRLSNEARKESGTLKKAEAKGTKIYRMYKEADRALRSAKMTALNSAKKATRQQFFDTISTIEINKQLDLSMLDLNEGDWEPKKVEHYLEERRVVADIICQDAYELSDQDKFRHRIRTANALVALCQKKDIPLRHKPDRTWRIQYNSGSPDRPPFPKGPTTRQCVFCFWNTREPYEVRLHNFSTVSNFISNNLRKMVTSHARTLNIKLPLSSFMDICTSRTMKLVYIITISFEETPNLRFPPV
ncbi:uncharacterized protein Z518_08934 [Rhinocladiella mackenziei CBS 650.93]|uniref:Uncharacterized protein n=1 Tax=Rhinocladiella mackenziei CBS 650.93 TaxID=1442369 RepID=A0A0D2I5Y3_9EURO|nr:uncharacterized protein Z518_08934 [Rhinocladiella mackenziei CBS 650.93]KIX01209.1 hypothetical protein Z518_08934 [Rhinocladiella mackenziei CBS 650.93]